MTNYILGSGIAGISFAFFAKNQHNIILEKNKKIGGRIESIKFGKEFVETGAQFFSEEDINLIPLIKKLNFENKLRRMKLSEFTVFNNNKFVQIKDKDSYNITNKEKEQINKFHEALNTLESDYFFGRPPSELLETNFEEWYKEKIGKESFWLIEGMTKAITFAQPKDVAAVYGLFACSVFFSKCYTLKGGLHSLCKTMLKKSKAQLKLNTEIEEIIFDDKQVKALKINQNGKKQEINIKKGDKVISSIPANNLAKIVSNKQLSNTLKTVEYNKCTFIILETDKKLFDYGAGVLFPKEEHGISIIIDEPYYFNFPYKKGIVGILLTYKEKRKLSIDDAIIAAEKIAPNLRKHMKSKYVVEWEFGLPVYNKKLDLTQKELAKLQFNNFAICGDFMHLPSLDGAIQSAKEIAEK